MSANTMAGAFAANFLGNAPGWFKATIIALLLANAALTATFGPVVTAWALLGEFVFCLAMALRCHPLQPAGLLLIEAVVLGLTSPAAIYDLTVANFPVIMLLIFIAAAVHFMQDMLVILGTRVLLAVHSRALLAVLAFGAGAVLSVLLDGLTIMVVVVAVAAGIYAIYSDMASRRGSDNDDAAAEALERAELDAFRAFVRSLVMHVAAGSALGGLIVLFGEPQNLLVARALNWSLAGYTERFGPVWAPLLVLGLATCVAVERTHSFGYGASLPRGVRDALARRIAEARPARDRVLAAEHAVQAGAALLLLGGLAMHAAEVGIIGVAGLVLVTAFNGITNEHRLGHAFRSSMPFVALLVVAFGFASMVHEQRVFTPLLRWTLSLDPSVAGGALFVATGVLSALADNVFVASMAVTESVNAFQRGLVGREHLDLLGVAANAGSSLVSLATPNGQAALLFVLTSALAALVRLSYGTMVWMALPYTLAFAGGGLACILMQA